MLAAWLAEPLWRVVAWAVLSAGLSMAIYFFISPQKKIVGLKEEQKSARQLLLKHDGDFDELKKLIGADLALTLRQLKHMLFPFLLSLAPLFVLMIPLAEIYNQALTDMGPSWTHGFEFWYVATLVVASLLIKVIFKIA
jgi:hypothetical protein